MESNSVVYKINYSDSTTCEIEGIVLGLEMSVQYYKERIQKRKQEVVYILSDCTAAIDMVIHRSGFLKLADLYNRLKRVQNSLSDLNISACIIWIPGHHGIAFNQCADRLAKQLAYDIFLRQSVSSFHCLLCQCSESGS